MPSSPDKQPQLDRLTSEWDQADAARKIVESAPGEMRKRRVRKRVSREEAPKWDADTPDSGAPTSDDLIEQLDDEFHKGPRAADGTKKRRQQGVHIREVQYTPGRNFGVIVTLFTFLAIAGAITYAVKSKQKTEKEADYISGDLDGFMRGEAGSVKAPDPTAAPPAGVPTVFPIGAERLAPVRECIEGFLTAGTIDERFAFVRRTEGVREHMEKMADHPIMRTQIKPIFARSGLEKENFFYAEIREAGVGYRGAIVEIIGDTGLLDFDSFMGYSELAWVDLESGSNTPETEVRALVSLLPPNKNDGPSRRRAIVRDPTQTFTVYSEIEIFGVDEKYMTLLERSRNPLPYIIKIKSSKSEDGNRSASEITDIVSAGWFKEVDFITAPDIPVDFGI